MKNEYPQDLKYVDSHEYVRVEGDIATIGITSFAVNQLGDIVFIEMPEINTDVTQGDNLGSIESVKAVESIYAPISGTIVDRNDSAIDSPEILGESPYTDGWIIKIRISNPEELETLMTVEKYISFVEG